MRFKSKRSKNMTDLSPLQKARYQYAPKLPKMLRNGISEISVLEGEETTSVADQEKIKALFPNTYGKKEITFQSNVRSGTSHYLNEMPVLLSRVSISFDVTDNFAICLSRCIEAE